MWKKNMSVLEIYRPIDAEDEVFFQTEKVLYNAHRKAKQIDYSRAKKKPQIYAALAGTSFLNFLLFSDYF